MKRLLLALVLSVGISGCATVREYNRIDAEMRPEIKKMETVLIVKQSELGSDIDQSNISTVTGGGLIPALIDAGINSKRTKKAEALIGPIRDKLIDYDFATKLEGELEGQMKSVNIKGADDVKLVRAEDKQFRQTTLSGSDSDIVMFIDAGYKLSPDFDTVTATANVMAYPVKPSFNPYKEKPNSNEKLAEHKDNVYRNTFKVDTSLDVSGDKESNAAALAQMPPEKLTEVFDAAAKKLATQIVHDFKIDDTYEKK